ncbi:MAG: hypothetical protein ACJAV1_003384 [Paraglaciecola sp.]|jgi:hypothetical protein
MKVRHHEKIIVGCIITAGILLAGIVQLKIVASKLKQPVKV